MADVLVVGAGPTGLFMAAELKRHGLSVRIVEKNLERASHSRALAIQPRTLEIFHHVGIVDRFLERGLKVRAFNPVGLGRVALGALDTPYPFILSLEQTQTEQILEGYLSELGVSVERGVEWHSLEGAKWIIGCDGCHSSMRKMLGMSFEGRQFPSTFSLADLRIDWSRPHDEAYGFLGRRGLIGVIPLPKPHLYRLVLQLERVKGPDCPPPTLEELQARLPGAKLSDPVWLANFQIHTRMVSQYRKGNVFLAGDAAHIHSPVGGQGMNSGLQDAFNLAWKLALVEKGKADSLLLDTYHLERHHFGKNLLNYTEKATRMIALRNRLAVFLRNAFLAFILRFSFVRAKVSRAISQLAICYPKSAIVFESGRFFGGPRAGMRVVNVSLFGKEGQVDLFSLWQKSTTHQILVFGDEPCDLPHYTRIVRSNQAVEGAYLDPVGNAFAAYGVKQSAVYIVRPDLVIGHRSAPADWKKVEEYLRFV